MQQTVTTARGTFGAGLIASVAVHMVFAVALLVGVPLPQPAPEPEETVAVEMVPEPEKKSEPEKKPEPEKQPEEKPQAEEKPEPQMKPAEAAPRKAEEKPAPAEAEARPADQQTEAQPRQPQAFEAASKQGGRQAGGDRPAEPVENKTQEKAALVAQESPEKPVATPERAKPPELDLPETANARQTLNEGDAAIEAVPKPEEKPVDASKASPRQSVSLESPPDEAKVQRPPSELREVEELFSADALANPRMRQALGKLPANRRIVQICTIETLEQIRRARPENLPEGLVPFADGRGLISGQVLSATGGAYVSRGTWYDVAFECTVDDKVESVKAFRFAVGKIVSERERKARGLPDG